MIIHVGSGGSGSSSSSWLVHVRVVVEMQRGRSYQIAHNNDK